ncbi:hypothetical protein GCM10023322_41480 [Rugosimonospora acidiphila]|uniref:TrbC/VIRB2 family protein n=1 Tax=Rugosimonospora acidiphila TaxID=556531 RepID=A0ABP9RZX8_9ACTN
MSYDRWLGRTPGTGHSPPGSGDDHEPGPAPRRRSDWRVVRHSPEREDLEPVEGEKRYGRTIAWTLAWYVVPLALFTGWTMLFADDSGPACYGQVDGSCPSVPSAVLGAFTNGLPQLCAALMISLLSALLIRLGSGAWRPVTAAFAAAVIGAGASTLLFSAIGT